MPLGDTGGVAVLLMVYVSPFLGSYGTVSVDALIVMVCGGSPNVTWVPGGKPESVPVDASYFSVIEDVRLKSELAAMTEIFPVPVFELPADAIAGDVAAISAPSVVASP